MKSFFQTLPGLLIAFVIISLAPVQAEKVMRPKFKELRLWSDEKFVNHDVKMDASDPHLNLTLNVLQQLHSVDLHIEAEVVKKQRPEYFFNVNTTVNLCNILHFNAKSPVGAVLVAYLKQYGRILDKCPIKKATYNLHKFWIPEDTTLGHFAEANFVISFTAIHVDAAQQKTVIIKDYLSGELLVQDVKNVKPGFLAMFSKAI